MKHYAACTRTPILVNGNDAARRTFEAAPEEVTAEYTTDWMPAMVKMMNQTSEVGHAFYYLYDGYLSHVSSFML